MCRARLMGDIAYELALTDEVLCQEVGSRYLPTTIVSQVKDEPIAPLEATEDSIDIAVRNRRSEGADTDVANKLGTHYPLRIIQSLVGHPPSDVVVIS